MWNTDWKAARPSLIPMFVASAIPSRGRPRDPLADGDHRGNVSAGCRQIHGVPFRNHQRVATGERTDVEDRQVIGVFVDPNGRGIPATIAQNTQDMTSRYLPRGQGDTLRRWTLAICFAAGRTGEDVGRR